MATVTNAIVRVQESGQCLRSDCFGNNAAIECPRCLAYPVLLVAVPNQRGASPKNPGICRHCGCRIHILDDVSPGDLQMVNVAFSSPASDATDSDTKMDWQQLLQALQQHVGFGQVTTYGNCSQWAYGHRDRCPAVVAMLNAAAKNGRQQWTNRVVRDDGDIAPEPDQAYGQRAQLQAEGVLFTPQGRVDFAQLPAVVF